MDVSLSFQKTFKGVSEREVRVVSRHFRSFQGLFKGLYGFQLNLTGISEEFQRLEGTSGACTRGF